MYVLSFFSVDDDEYVCEASFYSEDKAKLKSISNAWNKALDCDSYKDLPEQIKLGEFTFVKGESKDRYKYICEDMKISMSSTSHISKARSV